MGHQRRDQRNGQKVYEKIPEGNKLFIIVLRKNYPIPD